MGTNLISSYSVKTKCHHLIKVQTQVFGKAKPDRKRGQFFRSFYKGTKQCFAKTGDLASKVWEDLHDNNLREWLEQREKVEFFQACIFTNLSPERNKTSHTY